MLGFVTSCFSKDNVAQSIGKLAVSTQKKLNEKKKRLQRLFILQLLIFSFCCQSKRDTVSKRSSNYHVETEHWGQPSRQPHFTRCPAGRSGSQTVIDQLGSSLQHDHRSGFHSYLELQILKKKKNSKYRLESKVRAARVLMRCHPHSHEVNWWWHLKLSS